ncbi:glycosyltransferase family 2 protein [Ignavibacterium album]|uniref:glycosyltransferase family 2 protein n=1 Tax=Ignavibacterium album TaxID=591197 RepID=UPI0035B9611F
MIKLSVVIPTIGRKQELLNTIKDLSKQNLPRDKWECLIITQSEIDIESLKEIAIKNSLQLKVFYSKQPNASLARNIGLIEASGDIVLFLDDDLIIENPNFLSNHLRHYIEKNICGVVGQVTDITKKVRNDRHKWSYKKRVGWLYFPSNYNNEALVPNGGAGNISINKKMAIDTGGMDINYEKGAHREESDFCLRLTNKYGLMVYDPEASVIHIGANTGGCRTWGMNTGIHPLHHIIGEWYFILNGLKQRTIFIRDLHHHLAALFFRQIFNERNRKNPFAIILSVFKSVYGFVLSLPKVITKPKTLDSLMNYNYKLIYSIKK